MMMMMMNYRAKQEEEEEETVDPNDNQMRSRSLSSSSTKMMNNTVVNSLSTTTMTTTTSSRQWANFKNPRIVRVSRTFGGKDRHSKVCTVRGLRDRRIRLSVPTAIQLYDLQDRLGLSQPSKVVDWLLDATKTEIDKLPPLQMPPVGNTGTINFNNFFQPLFPPPPPPPPSNDHDHDHDERRHQTQEEFSAAVAAQIHEAQNFFPPPSTGLSFMNPYFQNMDSSSSAAAAPNYLSLSQFGNHSCFPIQLPTGGVAADHHHSHSYFCPLPSAAPPQPTFPSVHSNIIIPQYNNINHQHDHNNHHFQFLINNSSSSAAASHLHNNNIIRRQKEEEGGGGGRS